MKAMIYQALDWFDAQGTVFDVAMWWGLAMMLGLIWFVRGRR